jgi:hypothetical protein
LSTVIADDNAARDAITVYESTATDDKRTPTERLHG